MMSDERAALLKAFAILGNPYGSPSANARNAVEALDTYLEAWAQDRLELSARDMSDMVLRSRLPEAGR